MEKFLEIKDLKVSVPEKEILKGVDLVVNPGEIHIVMGPNGNGKSTLASAIMGNPVYEVTDGSIMYKGEDLIDMDVDERARKGVFLAMQYPSELSGVSNSQFIKAAINARRDKENPISVIEFYKDFKKNAEKLEMSEDYPERFVNVGFSGGEKKRNEIFQMLSLKPNLIILDEIDSGLDIDAVRIVGQNVMDYYNKNKETTSIIVITHYPRLLEYVTPQFVHIMKDGRIVKTGNHTLVAELDKKGYSEV